MEEENKKIETETPSPESRPTEEGKTQEAQGGETEPKKKGFKVWWQNHKPTKRRLIQVYAALLYNVHFRGFFNGRIYKGPVKGLCVPGFNCYSCPGAAGACPLGSIQNALAHSSAETPNAIFYVFGIILLFGVLLGRTICGFLCPVGLGQELLYKIKTPKVKKSRVTYVLSYLKYVFLAVLVIAVPLLFNIQSNSVVPGFCKYVCPAGTFGGAIGLLMNPVNNDYFGMLDVLFTWKFVVMVVVILLSIFIFRFFCRFICPLGAIYGFFNKISIIGVGLDKNKCTDCGLCVSHCKMDIKHVGDHECVNCGDCISVCPAKAISWKGSKLLLHRNAVEAVAEPAAEEKPLSSMLSSNVQAAESVAIADGSPVVPVSSEISVEAPVAEAPAAEAPVKQRKKRGRKFYLEVTAWVLALVVFAGAFVYYNFIYYYLLEKDEGSKIPPSDLQNYFSVTLNSGSGKDFTISKEGETATEKVEPLAGEGTEAEPYIITSIEGVYSPKIREGETVYYCYRHVSGEDQPEYTSGPYTYSTESDYKFEAYYVKHDESRLALATIEGAKTETFSLVEQGYQEGNLLYGFELDVVSLEEEKEKQKLSDHYGKVTVINFWYTSCGPCVAELPYFAEMADKYKDQIDIVAIHRAYEKDSEIVSFIEKQGWNTWNVSFLHDTGSLIVSNTYALYGGKDAYPMTVIIDANGFVTCHNQGPIAKDVLEAEILKAIG